MLTIVYANFYRTILRKQKNVCLRELNFILCRKCLENVHQCLEKSFFPKYSLASWNTKVKENRLPRN